MTDRHDPTDPFASLPPEDAEWLVSRVEAGEDRNAYVARLIARDRENHAKLEQMREWVREGLESGVSDMTVEDVWNEAVARRAKNRQREADGKRTERAF